MVDFKVDRKYLKPTYTISNVSYQINNGGWLWLLNGLEPPVGTNQHGEAIPTGTYDFIITMSPTFKFNVPLLLDVPQRTEIEWHPGCFPHDTHGCLCTGINSMVGRLTNSVDCFEKLMNIINYNIQPKYSVIYTQNVG